MRRALQLIGCLLGLAWLLALGCDSGPPRAPQVGDYRSLPPASSQQRAEARAERAARRKALEQQGVRPAASTSSLPTPPPPPPPPPPAPETSASATPEEIPDAGPAIDASVDAAVVDAGLTNDELCARLCDRVMSCALEMLEKTAGNLDPPMLDRMKDNMRAGKQECLDRCGEKAEDASEEELATAKTCLADPDCEAFMDCVRDLMK